MINFTPYYLRIGQANDGCEDEIEFERSIERLFAAMSSLLRKKEGHYLTAQGGCLKHIPGVIPELCTVFSARKLRYKLGLFYVKFTFIRLIPNILL